jgi:hypothetical protein
MKCCISVEKKKKDKEVTGAYGSGQRQKSKEAYRSG